jgi:tripartite ATP-independent transporter DctP family solute receptor
MTVRRLNLPKNKGNKKKTEKKSAKRVKILENSSCFAKFTASRFIKSPFTISKNAEILFLRKGVTSMKKLLTAVCAVVAAATMFAGCSKKKSASQPMVLRFAENQAQDYPTTKGAYEFARIVEEKTNGRIKVEVYYGAQLGDEKSVTEQMQFGAIDFSRVSLSPLAEFSKSLNVLQLPYLYSSSDAMWKVLDGPIGQQFLDSVSTAGLVGLAWYDSGSRNFYNWVRPVTKLADLKDMKIRVQENQQMMDMIQALGAHPTPMPYGEVYSALQTKVVDGAENNWPSYESTSHYEVAKYFVTDQHNRVPEMVIASKKTWDKLSPEDQQIMKDAALASAQLQRKLWAEREQTSKDKVIAAGCVVTELAPGEKEKFQAVMAPLYKKYGAGYEDIIAKIQATK